ncbi:MAG: hypothetical protein K1X55_09140 [Chitinophagales bacterium]|nr:hypothetical protein [Chitinophagales bacterium]
MIKSIDYELYGYGWARMKFICNDTSYDFGISYLSNPLHDLFMTLESLILKKTSKIMVSFFDEPGNNILEINQLSNNYVSVDVFFVESADVKIHKFSEQSLISTFAKKIIFCFDKLLSTHTLKEYVSMWGYDFPIEQYSKLRILIHHYFWD